MLGFQKRNFSVATTALIKQPYITYVHPNLEYTSSAWHRGHTTLFNKLEAVQNHSPRFIMSNYHRTASATSMKSSQSHSLLATRQKLSHLCLFHQMCPYNHTFNAHWIRPASFISLCQDNVLKVCILHHNTVAYSPVLHS